MSEGMLELLRELQEELHDPAVRRSQERLEALLHPNFAEIGRSGRVYTREDVMSELTSAEEHGDMGGSDYAFSSLAEGVALLTYKSFAIGADGRRYRHAHRSSIWVETPDGWKLRFHQGTPSPG